jgi:hypothetical protein
MKKSEVLTISNVEVRTIDRWNSAVFNRWQEHTIPMAQGGFGPVADRAALRALVDSGAANWSDDEIAKVAHHIEERAIMSGV